MISSNLYSEIESYLYGNGLKQFELENIEQEAGHRRYFRVIADKEFILCYDTKIKESSDYFIIRNFLEFGGLPVPSLIFKPAGFLYAVSDAGRMDFSRFVSDLNQEHRLSRLKEPVEFIKRWIKLSPEVPVRDRFFNKEKFHYEFDYLENAIQYENRNGLQLPSFWIELKNYYSDIVENLVKNNNYFVHRDFHSRNIMVNETQNFTIIDFQDARCGNIYYDLASFIFDPYADFSGTEMDLLIYHFSEDLQDFDHVAFYGQALQRIIKATGTYIYQSAHGNKKYLSSLSSSVKRIENIVYRGKLKEIALAYACWLEENLHKGYF